jgi:hypothetical protein
MLDPVPASPSPLCRRLRALVCLSVLGLCASPATALPPLESGPAPGPLLAQGEPPGFEQRAQEDPQRPFDALLQVLEETRVKLEELTEAAATAAADTEVRKELEALRRDNERLATELAQANARRIELERSGEVAQARVAELTEAVEEAVRKASRVDEALAGQIRRNQQLDEGLAGAETARAAAVAEAEKTRAEMAKTLEAATDEAARSKAELASLREELEANLQELATAKSAREEVKAWASKLEEVEKEIASWRTSLTSAIKTARQNFVMMEEKIEELNAALALGQPGAAAPAPAAEAKPMRVEDERATPARSPAVARPSGPEPASETDASLIERSESELSRAEPTAAPADADSRLAGFHANVEALNELELSTEGVDLFSGVASVDGRTVHVGATAAWNTLPTVGKQSYLDALLYYWVAAQGGQDPAAVRIVDPSGLVLGEKLWP